jgi:hypothetical protein
LPRGEQRSVESGAIHIPHAGAYALQNGNYQAAWYANLFDEIESDIGRARYTQQKDETLSPQAVVLETASTSPEVSRSVPVEFGYLLYYGAAALLFLEWLYSLWRYSRAGAA